MEHISNTPSVQNAKEIAQPNQNPKPVENKAVVNPTQKALENKLTVALQESVDQRGKYGYKLNDLALGMAAGAGIKEVEAREQIKDIFENSLGVGLQDYLEQHREDNGLTNKPRDSFER